MKIAIMTWYSYVNYGTALQVTALSEYLKNKGHDVDIIDYPPRENSMDMISSVYGRIISKVFKKIRNFLNSNIINEHNKDIFVNYINNHIHITEYCENQMNLERLNNKYDAFICGSDQIWSPLCYDPHYFLDFVKDKSKMIAYAPSIGTNEFKNPRIREHIKFLVKRFEYLSVREKTGAKLLEDLLSRPVQNVIDPTLLLHSNEWKNVLSLTSNKCKYVVAYFLGNNEIYWKKTFTLADKLKLPVKIIPVFKKDYKRNGEVIKNVGPKEFVNLIKNAFLVCTDSFHGIAFSVNFKVNFCCFERFKDNDDYNQNSRIYDFLDCIGLKDRLWTNSSSIDLMCQSINYADAHDKLEKAREVSENYLLDSLNSVSKIRSNKAKNNIYKNNSLCCGCGACASVCPKQAIIIKMTDSGFYEAHIKDEKCVSCGKCINVCPIQNNLSYISVSTGKLYSYKDNNKIILKKSSSGAVAYRLSKQLLNKGYAVVGCTFSIEKQKAEHIIIMPGEEEKLSLLQGSKYMQSDFSSVASKLRKITIPIAIFGTPCEIAGARNLLNDRSDVLYIDLICHGVPSYLLFKQYKKMLVKRYKFNGDKNIDIIFRFKEKGWREIYIYTTDFTKERIAHQSKDEYFQFFSKGFCYSKACYECKWRTHTEADIRIGDYWGNRFLKDKTGVSMVMVMNKHAEIVIKDTIANLGILKEQPKEDFFITQQMLNYQRPIFYEELIEKLKQPELDLKNACDIYAMPYEKWEHIVRSVRKIYDRIKK